MKNSNEQTQRIAALNDQFRSTFRGGEVVNSKSLRTLSREQKFELYEKVMAYDDFTPESDPAGEHNIGTIEHYGELYLWAISYYDVDKKGDSRNPANEMVTNRVLVIVRADEW